MHFIFLSPHPDDVALSCGGFICQLQLTGHKVSAWTICCGDIPKGRLSPVAKELHERWGFERNAPALRRAEDSASMNILGVPVTHFSIPDCIYRRNSSTDEFLIQKMADLFSEFPVSEEYLVDELASKFAEWRRQGENLVSPFGLGNHIDHILVRRAAEKVTGQDTWYYADYPYTLKSEPSALPHKGESIKLIIGKPCLETWQKSIAAHHSQISTFWGSTDQMQQAIEEYQRSGGGSEICRVQP